MRKRPHVILLIADQWRAETTGYCGNPVVKTPCIDQLAADGAGFTKCFVQNPVSTPSRAALASARYPHVSGHRTMHHLLRANEANMLRTLKESGYFVWWGGKNDMIALDCVDLSCHVRERGTSANGPKFSPPTAPFLYSFLYGKVPAEFPAASNDDDVIEKAVRFIESYSGDEPLCMLVNQSYPHPPYAAAEPWYSMYDRSQVPFPRRQSIPFEKKPRFLKMVSERQQLQNLTDADWRELVAVYYGMVSKVDANLGAVIEALKKKEMYQDSIVVISSDHGDFTGDYLSVEKAQNTFEDVLTNVPLAIKAPGMKPLGHVSEALCQWIDIMPTIFDLAQVEPVETHFGLSMVPLLEGKTASIRDYVFSEGGALATEVHTHESARPEGHQYWPRLSVQLEHPDAHGKAAMVRSKQYKYVRRLYDIDELYDLQADPDELVNRIDDPALADVQKELRTVLMDWFLETGDAVPWRWNQRDANEEHPEWSLRARTYGTV